MSFVLFTDSCSNLPTQVVKELDIHLLPCAYSVGGQEVFYSGDLDQFDSHAYYDKLRAGELVSTSLLNMQLFLDLFQPVLEAGQDIVYVGMSSGISGTYHASTLAAQELAEQYPDRVIRTVDSHSAGIGVGILACKGADLRSEGKTADEAADILEDINLLEYFTVDDLKHLHRTGRLSAAGAVIGSVLNIKPLLRGDEAGHIVTCGKFRGRKKAVSEIIARYAAEHDPEKLDRVAISHGDCPEEAEELARQVREVSNPRELYIVPHEPFTGAHVGPGMLAVYFFGKGPNPKA